MNNVDLALIILIPLGVGLYIYAIIRFREQCNPKNELIGWTIENTISKNEVKK